MTRETEELTRLMGRTSWYHKWEILPGIWTPGLFEIAPHEILDRLLLTPERLCGKTVLDIGAFDGALSLALHARGAKVTAFDIQNPDNTGFNIARGILQYDVPYVQGSVMELEQHFDTKFDIIFFFGVYYHLKNPIDALNQIRRVLSDDGVLFVEGECLLNQVMTIDNAPPDINPQSLANSNIPLALSCPGEFKGSTNWFVPNRAGLDSWLNASGFSELKVAYEANVIGGDLSRSSQRIAGSTQKLSLYEEPVEHAVFSKFWINRPGVEVAIQPIKGLWKEDHSKVSFYWCENIAEFSLSLEDGGDLYFVLAFPDVIFHHKILPLNVEILVNNVLQKQNFMEKPGEYEVLLQDLGRQENRIKIISDKFIIPHEHIQNSDMRKLSVIMRNMGVQR